MQLSFSFNGVTKPYVKCEIGKTRQVYNINRNMLYIPGRVGAYLDRTDIDIKVIEQPIFFEGTNKLNARRLEEELASWLITEQPAELVFTDEPDRIYYAVVDGTLDLETISNFGRGTIRFLCPDSYKYTSEFTKDFDNDFATIRNQGTAEAQPIIEMEVLENVTYAMIKNNYDEHIMIGAPYDVTEREPYQRETLSFDKIGNSLSGLTQGTTVDGGIVDGNFYTTTGAFRASTYGANSSAWHGPALQMAMPELLNNYKVQTYFTVKPQTLKSFGRAEVYFLNSGGSKIGKIAMKNIGSHGGTNVGEIFLRNENTGKQEPIIQKGGTITTGMVPVSNDPIKGKNGTLTSGINTMQRESKSYNWNDFYGILRLEKSGPIFNAYIAIYDTKTKQYRVEWRGKFIDSGNDYQDPLASIQIHLGAYKGFQWIEDIAIHRVTVYKINPIPAETGVPFIAQAGDTIVFDHVNENLLINGESRVDLKDFAGEYFSLKSNLNDLYVYPEGAFRTKARYRERYK